MIQAPRWKKIKIKGLHLYAISDTFRIRESSTRKEVTFRIRKTSIRRKVAFFILNGKEKIVVVIINRTKKIYSINEIFFKTFENTYIIKDRDIPNIIIRDEKQQISANEDDYGLYANKNHWKKLKIEMREIKRLKKLMDQNEQD